MGSPRLVDFPVLRLALASALALAAVACSHATPSAGPGSDVKPDSADSASSSAAATDGSAGTGTASTTAAPKSSASSATTTPAAPATPSANPGAPTLPAPVPVPGTSQDVDVAAQLKTALAGVAFVSEADFPWSILQVDATGVTYITPSVVADRLGFAIAQLNGGENRDLSQLPAIVDDEGYAAFLEDMASDPSDPGGPHYLTAEKIIAASLQGTQVFFFDMDHGGNQLSGPIITMVVGKTAANTLVAMVSFQVAT
jgi:hypothetical protein